jgi:hypothetical protein
MTLFTVFTVTFPDARTPLRKPYPSLRGRCRATTAAAAEAGMADAAMVDAATADASS